MLKHFFLTATVAPSTGEMISATVAFISSILLVLVSERAHDNIVLSVGPITSQVGKLASRNTVEANLRV